MSANLSKRQANKLARLKRFGAKVVGKEVVYDEGVKPLSFKP